MALAERDTLPRIAAILQLTPGAIFAGDFQIVQPLSQGGMGEVYVVQQISTSKHRALKLMHPQLVAQPELRKRFEREARVGAQIESDHVVEVIGAGVDAATNTPWLAMELLQGEGLDVHLARQGTLPAAEAREILDQLCHALGAAHARTIVHRDLKPENIFLAVARRRGVPFTVKILDFGIAKVLAEAATASTSAIGSPLWMAPEQTQAGSNVGPPTDVWALGLIAFRLLSGRVYWASSNVEGGTTFMLMREILFEPLAPASARSAQLGGAALPPGFDGWFARCVAREMGQRFPDGAAAFAALDPILRAPAPAPPVAAAEPQRPPDAWGGLPPTHPPAPGWPTGPASPPAATPPGQPFGMGPMPYFGPSATPAGPNPGFLRGPPPMGGLPPQYPPTGPVLAVPVKPSSSWGAAGLVAAALAVLGVVGGGGGLLFFALSRPSKDAQADAGHFFADDSDGWSDEDAAPPVSSADPVWGARAAPVTLVLFSDFQCPFCSRVEATLNQIKEKYGKGQLRVVWKNNPLAFHTNAVPAAIAGEAVFRLGGSDAFWKFHASAFAGQKDLSPEKYEQWAVEAGVNLARFKEMITRPELKAKVDADLAVGKAAGVSGTPASLVNGVLLSGAQPIEKFTTIIDEQLAAARAALAEGTRPDQIYAKLSNQNRRTPAPDKPATPTPAEDDRTVWSVPIGNAPVKGSADALVTIVEFSDFQCPFCGRVEPALADVQKIYGDKVRLVWKNNPLPFHPRAEPAAELALEGRAEKGDRGFWEAHDLLFKEQKNLTDEDLMIRARELGLNTARVRDAIATHKYQAEITADQDLADDVQASGTPHFFINGRRLVGAQPIEKFRAMIDEELKKAEGLVARGVAARDVYAEIMKGAKEAAAFERKTVDAPAPASPSRGAPGARVVMQIFSDFQCPFCKRVEPTLKQVEAAYADRLRIVWRHKPLSMHPEAPLASEAAQEAWNQNGNVGFWRYHDTLFDKQGSTPDALKRPALEGYAVVLGLDMSKFRAALDSNANKAFVDAESQVADRAGISGTPAFVIGSIEQGQMNGYYVSGAQPFGKFKRVIDRALKDAGGAGAPRGTAPLKPPTKLKF